MTRKPPTPYKGGADGRVGLDFPHIDPQKRNNGVFWIDGKPLPEADGTRQMCYGHLRALVAWIESE